MSWVAVLWARTDERAAAEQLVRELAVRRLGSAAAGVSTGRLCPRCASTAHGRPHLRGWAARPAPGVSIARTPGVTVVALAAGPRLGVDVERLSHFTAAFAGTLEGADVAPVVLHPAERATTPAELAAAWVRKEALLKASGDGLTVDPAAVRLADRAGSPAVVEWPAAAAVRPDWLYDLRLPDDLRAAIAGTGAVGPDDVSVRQAGPGAPPG